MNILKIPTGSMYRIFTYIYHKHQQKTRQTYLPLILWGSECSFRHHGFKKERVHLARQVTAKSFSSRLDERPWASIVVPFFGWWKNSSFGMLRLLFSCAFFGEGKQIQVVCWIFDGWDTEMAHNFSSKEWQPNPKVHRGPLLPLHRWTCENVNPIDVQSWKTRCFSKLPREQGSMVNFHAKMCFKTQNRWNPLEL